MRTVTLQGFDMPVGAIGFGCASLGSRISAAQGLQALADAHAAGVNWFDVAPAYGAGDAEAILGRFAHGKRDQIVHLHQGRTGAAAAQCAAEAGLCGRAAAGGCTDAGCAAPSGACRRPATCRLPLTPQLITESLHRSLQRLGTDHVDVFALHKPAHADIGRDDVQRTLAEICGEPARCGMSAWPAIWQPQSWPWPTARLYSMVQIADDPVEQPLRQLPPQGDTAVCGRHPLDPGRGWHARARAAGAAQPVAHRH